MFDGKTWSCGRNSHLTFAVNMTLNLSNAVKQEKCRVLLFRPTVYTVGITIVVV